MKSMGDMLLKTTPFSEIVMGNTAVVRAMIEAGVEVVTSYPGSPTPEIAAAISTIPVVKRPFYFEFSTNEKVATEVAFGAAINGHPSCVFFKSVGLNVAADSFVQLSLMEIIGGMVVLLGDDPGANSSQNEQDNRHFARLSYTPVFEPADPEEVYTMFLQALAVSRQRQQPVILRLSTHVCHAKARVSFGTWQPRTIDPTSHFDVTNGPYIPITSKALELKERALAKLAAFAHYAETADCNRIDDAHNPELGIITMGLPYLSLRDVLPQASQQPDILKLGIVHPLPKDMIIAFLKAHRQVLVLEELDDFVEQQIKAIAYDAGLHTRILGKATAADWIGEYTPDKVYGILRHYWPEMLPQCSTPQELPLPASRPAQMCPGCGHRSAFYAISKALADTDITIGDIGCHTLGFLPPYRMGQALLSMGHSTATASGMALFTASRRVVAFIGDSTFFHAGMPGIVNALYNHHNLTLIVMENGTTAMTGHQNHPGSGHNFDEISAAIPIKRVLQGMGVSDVQMLDTYSQKKLIALTRETVAKPGFKVIIAKHPCMLKFTREQRRSGAFKGNLAQVNQQSCTQSYECVSEFACPSFQRQDDGTIQVSSDLCIGDGSCLATCPSTAIKITRQEEQA
jgi:indolepyruvate ferredoxin oxidoreductase alpha subunit